MVNTTIDEPLAVTQTRAAELLGVTCRSLRNWEKANLIKGNKVGKFKFYPYETLKALVYGTAGKVA